MLWLVLILGGIWGSQKVSSKVLFEMVNVQFFRFPKGPGVKPSQNIATGPATCMPCRVVFVSRFTFFPDNIAHLQCHPFLVITPYVMF